MQHCSGHAGASSREIEDFECEGVVLSDRGESSINGKGMQALLQNGKMVPQFCR
jgi:hypothetical protein